MSTRRINGFCDEMEFEVLDNSIVRIIDNGSSYKNKLRNGLLLDTLCFMGICYQCEENISYEKPLEKKFRKEMNYEYEETFNENIKGQNVIQGKNKRHGKNKRQEKNKKINKKEQNRRNKRKLLKIGNDYKMNQRQENEMKIYDIVKIPTNHFGRSEVDKYAPMCTDCFIHVMLTKKYYALYEHSYPTKFCNHIKCWSCIYKRVHTYDIIGCCCEECYDSSYRFKEENYCPVDYSDGKYIFIKYPTYENLFKKCCDEEYGYDYGKKYKCGERYEFDCDTKINYNHYLDYNGNIVVELFDENVKYNPIHLKDMDEMIELRKINYFYDKTFDNVSDYTSYSDFDDYDYWDYWD